MNICIDQGNSRTKVALFDDEGTMVKNFIYKSFTALDVERLFSLYPLSDSIISSVINLEPAMVNTLHRLSNRFILFDYQTPIPIINDYETPATLGQDRLAAAVGAATLYPHTDLLIIDAGSAITYDVLRADGHYQGGNIAPGLKMRFKALHQLTKKLPLIEAEENGLIPLFGKNTHDAILSGVLRGVAFEVKGYMRSLTEMGIQFVTVLTGGNAPYVMSHVKSKMKYEKHLVLIGLNAILNHSQQ